MNEKIKKIAKEAGEYANLIYVPPVRSKTPGKIWEEGHVDWHELFNQKFAELIVRECSAVTNHFSDGHEVKQFDDSKRYHYFVDIGKVILEHFGVEE